MDVVSGGRIGGQLAMAMFLTPTRLVEDVPSSTYGHIATDGHFYFRTLYCCQVVYDRIDSGMID